MQKKTIKKVLKNKVESWIESIEDSALRFDVRKEALVSGGSIASMFLNETVNDYDIYIQDRDVLIRLVNYYIKDYLTLNKDWVLMDGRKKNDYVKDDHSLSDNQYIVAVRNLKEDQVRIFMPDEGAGYKTELLKEGDVGFDPKKKYRLSFISPNALSLTDDIQIVNRFFGTPEQIHKTFDFIHATNYFTLNEGLITNLAAVESILTKQLRYQGSHYPVTSLIRYKKFVRRGWSISAGEILKIAFQVSELDLHNIDVLEEQLIGVDVAYFGMLINYLREHTQRNPDFKPTASYIGEMIDRIFNLEGEDTE